MIRVDCDAGLYFRLKLKEKKSKQWPCQIRFDRWKTRKSPNVELRAGKTKIRNSGLEFYSRPSIFVGRLNSFLLVLSPVINKT